MKIEKIKKRSTVFKYNLSDWDLNIHLIEGNKYNYLIDTGLGSLSIEPIKNYLNDSSLPIIIINTHHHWDHVWGNSSFQDCTIISHKLCRDIIINEWDEENEKNNHYISGNNDMCLPNLTFDNVIYFPDDKIKIFYTPGHAIDSISVFDEIDGVLNVGDNIGDNLSEIVPDIETEKSVYIDTLNKYNNLNFDTCISGHNITLGKDIIQMILNKLSTN